jgi:RNA polymerase sporulation-specific sigma factor
MIAGEIRRYLRDNSSVRVSRSMRDTAYRALQAKERLTAQTQREPDAGEIAKELGVSRQEVYFALDAISEPISIYEPIFSDGGESICVMDQIGDNKNTDDSWIEQITLQGAVSSLEDREKRILALRFFDGKTQMEVASEVGISQAQVSRLEKNALGHIKKYMGME